MLFKVKQNLILKDFNLQIGEVYNSTNFPEGFYESLNNARLLEESFKSLAESAGQGGGTQTPISWNDILSKPTSFQPSDTFGYNMLNGLMDYRVALSNRNTTPCEIYCIGDSITRGSYTSDEPNTAWASVLGKSLQVKYGNSGVGFIGALDATLPTGAHSRVTFGAGWIQAVGTKSGFGGGYVTSNGATTPLTFNFTGDKFTIIYVKGSTGGTADIKVDGISVGTINCNNATISFNNYTTFSGLTNAAHVLTIVPANASPVLIEGITAEITAPGVRVHKIGVAFYTSGDWNNANTKIAWSGKPPHLAVIALGVNDGGTSVPLATYKANIDALTQHFRSLGSSVVLLPYMRGGSAWTTVWPSFVQANYEVADKYNVGLIDMHAAWNKDYTWGQTKGLFGTATEDFTGASGTNTAHPGDKGHRYIAGIIENYL